MANGCNPGPPPNTKPSPSHTPTPPIPPYFPFYPPSAQPVPLSLPLPRPLCRPQSPGHPQKQHHLSRSRTGGRPAVPIPTRSLVSNTSHSLPPPARQRAPGSPHPPSFHFVSIMCPRTICFLNGCCDSGPGRLIAEAKFAIQPACDALRAKEGKPFRKPMAQAHAHVMVYKSMVRARSLNPRTNPLTSPSC